MWNVKDTWLRKRTAQPDPVNTHEVADSEVLAAVFNSLSAHVVLLDRFGRVEQASRSWLAFARENDAAEIAVAPGVDYLEICRRAAQQDEPLARMALEKIEGVLKLQLPRASMEYSCHAPGPNGKRRWFLLNVDPMPAEHGGVVITHTDITQRVEAERALRDSEQRYRALVEEQADLICRFRPDTTLTFVNAAYADYFGETAGELLGRSFLDLLPEASREPTRKHIESLCDNPRIASCEREVRAADGVWWQHWIDRPILEAGVIVEFQSVGRDITERKRAELALRESEERYRALAETATDAILGIDQNSVIVFANPAVEKIFGYTPSELIGRSITVLMPESLRQGHLEGMQRYLERGAKTLSWDYVSFPGLDKYGREISLEISFAESRRDERPLFIGFIRDVTERKRAERALRDIVSGTAATGKDFFPALVYHLAAALDVHCAIVTELANGRGGRLKALSIRVGNDWGRPLEYEIAKTPCESVMRERSTSSHPDHVQELFPEDPDLGHLGAVGYIGTPLLDSSGQPMGTLCIIDNKPLREEERARSILEIFAARAAAELERKRAEDALRESEERLSRTQQFSLVMVTHTDLEGRWLKVPPTLCALLGYSESELVGRRFHEFTHPDDIEADWRQCGRLIKGEIKSFDLEKRYIRKDGGIIWVYLNVSVVTDAQGSPVHFLTYIRDITKRKRAAEALRESEERLKLALEAGQMGVWDWDLRKNSVMWSKEHFTIMGLVPFGVEPTYQTWAERVHPDDLPIADAGMKEAIQKKKEYQTEYRVIRPDGSIRWAAARGKPIYDEDGQCIRVMCLIVDITPRKHAEDELHATLEEVRRLQKQIEAENVYLREEVSGTHRLGKVVSRSEPMLRVLKQAEQVAPTDTTVLILGETGTGKELLARAIHALSKRKDRPLVKVNCAALPASLIESELFGHERGAFTGAASRRAGRFELADG
ncbi:MAG: PAS domain S-box protein, partial [Candidatus Binatia bacterium]